MLKRRLPNFVETKPPHSLSKGDPERAMSPVGIALAQAHQNLSILEHLESPSAHSPLPGGKSRKGNHMAFSSRCPSSLGDWLLYADHALAPICRSVTSEEPLLTSTPASWGLAAARESDSPSTWVGKPRRFNV